MSRAASAPHPTLDQPAPGAAFPRSRWLPLAAWGLLLAGVWAPLARYWLAGLTLIHRDQPTYFAPLRWIAGEALRHGRLPLWNPFCATGMPFLALMTHGAVHPLSVATAILFPSDGLDPLMGAYLLAAGLGAGLLARVLGASLPASVLAGFVYALSGYTLSTTSNINNLTGTAFLPWVPAGLLVTAGSRRALAFAAGATAVAACALTGDIQELAAGTLLGLALALAAHGRRGLLLALAASAVGGLLAGIQLAPSWSFLPLTHRIFPLPVHDVKQWDLEPWRLVELLSPGFFWLPREGTAIAPVYVALGHPTWFQIPYSESVFVGVAALALAAAAAPRSRMTRLLAAAALVGLWVSMGRHLGARALQDQLPLAKGFRYGEKFLPAFLACVAALAALGADHLTQSRTAAARVARSAALASSLLLAGWLLLETDRARQLFLDVKSGEIIRAHVLLGLPHAFVAGLALAGCLWLAARGRRTWALAGLVAVVWGSAVAASSCALRPGHREARIDVAPPPLSAEPPGPRIMVVQRPKERPPRAGWDVIDEFVYGLASSLVANTNARNRIDNFDVDSGFYPLRWYAFDRATGKDEAFTARRYSVTHLLFPTPATPAGQEIVARVTQGGSLAGTDPRTGMEIWTVPHRPWAAFPSQVVSVPDAGSALQAVLQSAESGWETAFVETSEPLPSAPGRILSVRRDLEWLQVVAETGADATLVVNDAFWPGWQARIDGRETPILPADALVRAVRWPAGRHTLLMRYDPPEVRVGIWLSIAGTVALIGACVALRRSS